MKRNDTWGMYIWYFLHKLTFYYLNHHEEFQKKKETLHHFFLFLGKILPCTPCKVSYQDFLQKDPPFQRKEPSDLARWAVHLHNTINMKLGKPTFSYQKAYLLYYLSECNHKLLFQCIYLFSQWTPTSSWLPFLKELFPCKICRENLTLLENKASFDWKENALSWMTAHLHDNPFGFESKHKSELSLGILENTRVLLLHNPREHEQAYARRWLPVLPHTTYKITYKGKSPTHCVAFLCILTKTRKKLPFQKPALFSWNDVVEQEVCFTTQEDSMIQLRIQIPRSKEPSVLYSMKVQRFQT